MSWEKLTAPELQSIRKTLCLDVSEAAKGVGGVSTRAWQHWEAGNRGIPDDIDMEMYGLTQIRQELIEALEYELDDSAVLKWYHTLDDFKIDHPSCDTVSWRLHQSVLAYIFTTNNDIELDANIETDKDCYLFKYFDRILPEQIEFDRQELLLGGDCG